MMKLTALKIDPEFQGKIPPLTSEELDQLEKNIISDGKVINPIIVWKGLIVDGHNRYAILQKHPDIPYTVHEKTFADRYEVIIWICKNQLGRRNLTPEQKKYLIGKQYEAETQARGFQGNQYTVLVNDTMRHSPKNELTCERIANEAGVGRTYVVKAKQYAKGVDAAEEAVPGTRQKVLSGEVKPTAAEIASVARAPPEDRPALVEKICAPKGTKKSGSKSTSKSKNVEKSTASTIPDVLCEVQAELPVIEMPPEPSTAPKQNQTALQTIRSLSEKMESVEQVADAEGMLSEVASAADSMIYRLDVCFEHYPEFLKNQKIRQKVVELLQKAKDYIVKLEGEFAYD